MDKYYIENEKYILRPIEMNDKENVIKLLRENKFFNKVWSSKFIDEMDESIFESVFMESGGSYCVISKISGEFSGYIEISPQKDGDEGELSVRLSDKTSMKEIIELFGNVFEKMGYKEAKNLTLQYYFD